jgi:lantibiotic modifying enzyme
MLGLSGIGYAILRMHDKSIPSILALDVIGID